jgi:hypothetical protein
MEANGYQIRKAKRIVKLLTESQPSLSGHQLARVVAIMPMDDWRTISFAAGEPVAELECKTVVLSLLRGRSSHAVSDSAKA